MYRQIRAHGNGKILRKYTESLYAHTTDGIRYEFFVRQVVTLFRRGIPMREKVFYKESDFRKDVSLHNFAL